MFLKLLDCGKQEWQENVSESINNHIKTGTFNTTVLVLLSSLFFIHGYLY